MKLTSIGIAILALFIFAIVLGCALATEAIGRWRHGAAYEPGDGLGCEGDYE